MSSPIARLELRRCWTKFGAARAGPHRFTLLVPDAPNAKTADWTLDGALPLLTRAARTQVEGISGGPDPLAAIREAVEHGSFDEIIISTLPKRTSRWLRRDLPRRVQQFGVPVTVISADKDFLPPSFLPEGIANAAGGSGMG